MSETEGWIFSHQPNFFHWPAFFVVCICRKRGHVRVVYGGTYTIKDILVYKKKVMFRLEHIQKIFLFIFLSVFFHISTYQNEKKIIVWRIHMVLWPNWVRFLQFLIKSQQNRNQMYCIFKWLEYICCLWIVHCLCIDTSFAVLVWSIAFHKNIQNF